MSWQQSTLGELVKGFGGLIQTGPFGSQLKQSEYSEEGVPVIMPTNIFDGRVNVNKIARVPDATAARLARHRIKPDTIVFPRRGEITKRAYITEDQSGWICGTGCLKIEAPENIILPKFLYYQMGTDDSVDWLQKNAVGATMLNLSGDILARYPVRFPDFPTQQRIAGILSAYDDLIENNRRRNGLLEQAARLLYREWFVHLRFPGHETAKFVDGLPEGWSIRLLADLCAEGDGIQTGPFGSQLHQSDYTDTGVPVVMPKDIKNNKVDCNGIARIPESLADKLGRHRMLPGDTVYGRRGDIGRRAFIGKRQTGFFCGTGCLRIRPDPEKINARYLFETLGSPATSGFIANQAKGSTMPNLSAGALKKVPVLCAPDALQVQFVDTIEPMLETAEILDDQITRLTRARDLLLPRLMDGRIPV